MNPNLPADLFTVLVILLLVMFNHPYWNITGISIFYCSYVSVGLLQIIHYWPKSQMKWLWNYLGRFPFYSSRLNDRRTPLGELNWIFTSVTDTIAWNVLPHELFKKVLLDFILVVSSRPYGGCFVSEFLVGWKNHAVINCIYKKDTLIATR